MTEIKYIVGDATQPMADIEERTLIIHVCNDIGGWGRGFVLALSKKWPEVEKKYREWYKSQKGFKLGNIQGVRVEDGIAVINMIAQRDIKTLDGVPPIRYGALRKCLQKVAELAKTYNASVHLPYRMGSDLAGGKWSMVEKILNEELCSKDISVTAYDINNLRAKGEINED